MCSVFRNTAAKIIKICELQGVFFNFVRREEQEAGSK